jgi:hypothetical protein
MRVPSLDRFARWTQSFALVICGMIIGAAVFMSITHRHLEDQIMRNRSLESEIQKLLENNESLKFYKNKQTIIKSVEVGVIENTAEETSLEPVIVSEIKERVEEDLKDLKGRPISYIDQDPQSIKNIYGERLAPDIHGKDYMIRIHTILVIYGELKVWVSAEEFIRRPS